MAPQVENEYKLIFDAQCLQTLTRQRGIGNYSINLIKAICNKRPNDKFAAILTTTSDQRDLEAAKKLLVDLGCLNLDILVFDPFRYKSKITIEVALARFSEFLDSLNCPQVISLSTFEKVSKVIPVPESTSYKRIAILYDLIPLEFQESLLISRRQQNSYFEALTRLRKFDLLLAISAETRKKWKTLVSSENRVEVIYGGGIANVNIDYLGFNDRKGVLCVGAELPHKNLKRLIEAYSYLPNEIRNEHKLLILGIRSSGYRNYLFNLAKKCKVKIEVPGYLSMPEMTSIFSKSRLLVMPSLVEGLSLPILDAWSHGLVVIGSKETVAEELINYQENLFNPRETSSIAKKMLIYLTARDKWELALIKLQSRKPFFSWENTAQLLLKHMGIHS